MKYFKSKIILILIILITILIEITNCFKLKNTLIDNTVGYPTIITKINIYSTTTTIIYLVSGSSTGSVTIWDIENEKIKLKFNKTNGGHTNEITSIISLENGYLSSGSISGSIKIWDIKKEKLIFTFDQTNGGHSDRIVDFVELENGDLASGSFDKTVKIWDLNNGKLKISFDFSDTVRRVVLLENGFLAISLSESRSVNILDIMNVYM
jgi:WD40 repeat protein